MAGTLYFDRTALIAEIEKVRAAPEHRPTPYDDEDKGAPALWLVGDQGVYLMGNHANRDYAAERPVYARGADPQKDPDFYDVKRNIFGGDDGVEALPLEMLEPLVRASKHGTIGIKITASSISVLA